MSQLISLYSCIIFPTCHSRLYDMRKDSIIPMLNFKILNTTTLMSSLKDFNRCMCLSKWCKDGIIWIKICLLTHSWKLFGNNTMFSEMFIFNLYSMFNNFNSKSLHSIFHPTLRLAGCLLEWWPNYFLHISRSYPHWPFCDGRCSGMTATASSNPS